jgi:hypothetical protein
MVTTKRLRSVHVPLSDEQWLALKIEATTSERTIGEVVASALAKRNGPAASPVQGRRDEAATKEKTTP